MMEKKANAIDFSHVTLFRHPITTLVTMVRVLIGVILATPAFLLRHFVLFTLIPALAAGFHLLDGPHTPWKPLLEEVALFAGWWVMLGVASSVGLGTGLHTFMLYLGPHIAKVTMASYECNKEPVFLPSKWSYDRFEECTVEKGSDQITIF